MALVLTPGHCHTAVRYVKDGVVGDEGGGVAVGAEAEVDEVEGFEEELNRDGQVRIWWDRNPVDLFFSYDPFHDQMRRSARRVPFADGTIPILSPEHLTVCKAMFDRPKDWLDIEQILVATDPLDLREIEDWLKRLAGGRDRRMRRLNEVKNILSLD